MLAHQYEISISKSRQTTEAINQEGEVADR
jgi:hypothetical protein